MGKKVFTIGSLVPNVIVARDFHFALNCHSIFNFGAQYILLSLSAWI